MAGVFAGAPLDLVRVRQQQPGNTFASKSIINLLRDTVKNEGGIRALFRGMTSPLSTASLINAVCFNVYGAASRQLSSLQNKDITGTLKLIGSSQTGAEIPSQPLSLQNVWWAGCIAGASTAALVTPVDVVKIRLQLQTSNLASKAHIGPLTIIKKLIASEGGVRSLYRGMGITLIRDVPSTGIYFANF